MKILILSRYQNTTNRGVESVVSELSKILSKHHKIDILSGKDSDSFKKMISGDYDIVMPFNGRMQALKASIGRIFSSYKLVIGGHSGIGRDDIWNIAVCKPDVFVALTNYQAKWAKKWAWGSKIIKIPNGIDLKKFNPNGEKFELDLKKPIILSVGFLSWYKYHDRVIQAVSLIDKGSLLIVGDGPQKDKLNELANNKLPGRFKILRVTYDDIPKIYRSVDLFTLPSWEREAFGIVYLEAIASGLPVVAPDDPARREIIGDAGEFVDTSKSQKYAEAIYKALEKKWGSIPRKQAAIFSWDKIASMYEECLQDLK